MANRVFYVLEADVISPSPGIIDVKVIEEDLIHHFEIKPTGTVYEITRPRGELVAMAHAVSEIDPQDWRSRPILIHTDTHVFEIRMAENRSFRAHKIQKKKSF